MRLKRKRTQGRRHRSSEAARLPSASNFSSRSLQTSQVDSGSRQINKQVNPKSGAKSFGSYWLQRFGLIILLIACVISAVNVMTLSTQAKVIDLSNQTVSLFHTTAQYQQAADTILGSSIWYHNKLSLNTNKISQKLMDEFPELSSVSVQIPLAAHDPIIYIEQSQPALILIAENGTFLLDQSGKALASAANAQDFHQPRLPVVTDKSLAAQINQQLLPSTYASFIHTVIVELASKQLSVTGMVMPAGTSELDVQLAGQAYIIKFNLENNDPRQQAGTYLATIAELHGQNITPSKYVDVRVDGRAYYQ